MSTFALNLAKRGATRGNTLELQGVGYVAPYPEITINSSTTSSSLFAVVMPDGVHIKQLTRPFWQKDKLIKVGRNADITKTPKVLKLMNSDGSPLELDMRSIAIYTFIEQFFENCVHMLKVQRHMWEDRLTIYTHRMLPIEISLIEHAGEMVVATVKADGYGVHYTTPITEARNFANSFMSLY